MIQVPRYIIHVGPHKTGTTYIQVHLKRHRDELAGHGIYYAREWITKAVDWCHYDLYDKLRAKQWSQVEEDFDQINQNGFSTVILSSEDLSTLGMDELKFLARQVGDDVDVVFYIRRWSQLLASAAQESIRHGCALTVAEIILNDLAAPTRSSTVNFCLKLDRLAEVFGLDNIKIVLFDNIVDKGGNLFSHFISDIVGCRVDLDVDTDPVHRSVSPIELELLRVRNYLLAKHLIDGPGRPWGQFLARVSKLDLTPVIAPMNSSLGSVQVDDRIEPLSSIYRRVYERYGPRMIGPRLDSQIPLFRQTKGDISYVQPNYLCDPGVAGKLLEICQEAA